MERCTCLLSGVIHSISKLVLDAIARPGVVLPPMHSVKQRLTVKGCHISLVLSLTEHNQV